MTGHPMTVRVAAQALRPARRGYRKPLILIDNFKRPGTHQGFARSTVARPSDRLGPDLGRDRGANAAASR
jgi:hypothetical protein